MSYLREPKLLTKLIHQWLWNNKVEARVLPCGSSSSTWSADLIRITNVLKTITVYSTEQLQLGFNWDVHNAASCRVKVGYNEWPLKESVWVDHKSPDFFNNLKRALFI